MGTETPSRLLRVLHRCRRLLAWLPMLDVPLTAGEDVSASHPTEWDFRCAATATNWGYPTIYRSPVFYMKERLRRRRAERRCLRVEGNAYGARESIRSTYTPPLVKPIIMR